MNLHVPQTLNARAEAVELVAVHANLLSPQDNCTLVGLVQDTLLGIYLLTANHGAWFDHRDASALLFAARPDEVPLLPPPAVLKPVAMWSGKQLVSALIPPWATLRGAPDSVILRGGDLLAGALTKRTVGRSGGPGSLVHVLARRGALAPFVEAAQKMATHYLLIRGFSCGEGSCVLEDADARGKVARLLKHAPDPADVDRVRDRIGRVVCDALPSDHALLAMAVSGSKGSIVNISQIIGLLGQQMIVGDPCYGGRARPRSLPHFARGDWSAAAGGYVGRSYLGGLDPASFWFHAAAGRVGLIDTSCKTSTTGYIARRLVKAMEDVHIAYDGTVRRGADAAMVAFSYGEGDGCDAARLLMVPLGEDDAATATLPFDGRDLYARARALDDDDDSCGVGEGAVQAFLDRWCGGPPGDPAAAHLRMLRPGLERLGQGAFAFFAGEVERLRVAARVHPGEMVGVLAACCLAAPATQLVLNTFHHAGSEAAVSSGVPRLLELLNMTRRPRAPRMTPAVVATAVRVRDLVVDVAHYYDGLHEDDAQWFEAHDALFGALPVAGRWAVRWTLTEPVPSHTWRRFEKEARHTVRFAATAWPAPTLVAVAADLDGYARVRQMQAFVEAAIVRGIAAGSDLHAAFAAVPRETAHSIVTNDPRDALATLGIEAARAVLTAELRAVLSSNGTYVDGRHTALLADMMCHEGALAPVTRHGCARSSPDAVLARASFESSVRALIEAARRGTSDPVRGVSAQIMLGRVAAVGTGLPSALFLDERVIERHAQPRAHGKDCVVVRQALAAAAAEAGEKAAPAAATTRSPFAGPSDGVGGISVFSPAFVAGDGDDDDDDGASGGGDTTPPWMMDDGEGSDGETAVFSPIVHEPTGQQQQEEIEEEEEPKPKRRRRCGGTHMATERVCEPLATFLLPQRPLLSGWKQAGTPPQKPFVFCVK